MSEAQLEHANITVRDPDTTARFLCDLLGWKIRWKGEAIYGGTTIHVGSDSSYLAIYTQKDSAAAKEDSYKTIGGLNHIGIVVDDLDAIEAKVREAGLKPGSHADYEPGRRFYFDDADGIEFEIISYKS